MPDTEALSRAVFVAIIDPGTVVARGDFGGDIRPEALDEWQLRAVLEAIRPFLVRPAKHDPESDCNCEPGGDLTARGSGMCEYRILADAADAAFNPPGDDIAEVAIHAGAIERAARYITDQACGCTPEMVADGKPCARYSASSAESRCRDERRPPYRLLRRRPGLASHRKRHPSRRSLPGTGADHRRGRGSGSPEPPERRASRRAQRDGGRRCVR